ncbi:MAG: rRNA maturation RNase YbeY [Planctomycetota bacterium]|nr:rRNA maturation RNase YbeY [Planctomycetota bacterium]
MNATDSTNSAAGRRSTTPRDLGSGDAADASGDADPDQPPPRSSFALSDDDGLLAAPQRAWLERSCAAAADAALREAGADPALAHDVRLSVVGDEAMTDLHTRWKDDPSTTDVLTFDLREDAAPGEPLDVDIVVCADEAARQALRRNRRPEEELLLYFVHGMLHCLGHDDREERASQAMHACEDRILAAIGVEPLYAVAANDDAPMSAPERRA